MRKILTILLLLLLSLTLGATTYYIAPTGNNSTGNGSIGSPYLSLATPWALVSAGDTIYVRGGTYAYTTSNTLSNKGGTADSLICILNYPGEIPVFDYSGGVPYTSQRNGFSITNVSYLKIRGIRVTGITQPVAGTIAMYGMILWDNVTHSIFELMEFDHIGGWGVTIGDNCSDLLFLNCDSHHHQDQYSAEDQYGWSDGFQTGSLSSTGITFVGCRAWSNADDGWDFRGANGIYTLINCWSFRNGFIPDTWDEAGNGVGFKMGGKSTESTTDILRHVNNCVAFENRMIGFNLGAADANKCLGAEFYHCTAYNNYQGFNVNSYTNNADIKNSISYDNSGGNYYGNAYTTVSACSWSGFTVTDGDFVSLDTTGVSGARQSDGSLPIITFLHLVDGSDLKDAGTAVGVNTDADGTTRGYLPDIGAYEIEDIRLLLLNNKLTIVNDTVRTIRK